VDCRGAARLAFDEIQIGMAALLAGITLLEPGRSEFSAGVAVALFIVKLTPV
jgi:hypothetical protein